MQQIQLVLRFKNVQLEIIQSNGNKLFYKCSQVFNTIFCKCRIVDMLMQHEFDCVNLIGEHGKRTK